MTSVIWDSIINEAEYIIGREPLVSSFLQAHVLGVRGLDACLASILSERLSDTHITRDACYDLIVGSLEDNPDVMFMIERDLQASVDRDPACNSFLDAVFFSKGFVALTTYRISRIELLKGHIRTSLLLKTRNSEVFGVDVHPSSRIGSGVMIDHATGVVIGETAVLGNDSSLLHGVTLGGTGKVKGDRHPKIGEGVMIGAGASVLGNIKVGDCARVGAGSVVLNDVAKYTTVAGVPARVVGVVNKTETPSEDMDQRV